MPPEEIYSKPSSVVSLAVPPDRIFSLPPARTMMPLLVWLAESPFQNFIMGYRAFAA
jgi:hypothetical protein